MGPVSGKNVFITGCGTGIGRAIAKRLAKDGATLILTDKNETSVNSVLQEVQEISKTSVAYQMDVTDGTSIEGVLKKVLSNFSHIDILVNNAGVSTENWFWKLTEEEWDFNMDINCKGVWRVSKYIAPHMIERKQGKIICTASMASKMGAPFQAHYAASKFGVLGLVQSMAKELAPYGITVNAVCPGMVKTGMQDREVQWEAELRGIADPEIVRQEYIKSTPLGRLCMPEDVANVVAFLASPDSDFMTGQGINVTGGICMH
jgi:NAD(P)-dependent dehydrogenase (short-subunit alcohol dehydrogenase family)